MSGKFNAWFVSPLDRHEKYVRLEFYIVETQPYPIAEVHFPNVDSDEILIKFHEPDIEGDALEFMAFLQKTVKRLIEERAPPGQRLDEVLLEKEKLSREKKIK